MNPNMAKGFAASASQPGPWNRQQDRSADGDQDNGIDYPLGQRRRQDKGPAHARPAADHHGPYTSPARAGRTLFPRYPPT